MKLVLNKTYGAFHLSDEALCHLARLKGINLYPQETDDYISGWFTDPAFTQQSFWDPYSWDRTDPDLVRTVEELGEAFCPGLEIRDLMEGQQYRICEYDGKEWLEFPSDINWEVAT